MVIFTASCEAAVRGGDCAHAHQCVAFNKAGRPSRGILVSCCTMGADGWRKFLRWIHAGDLALDPSEKKAAAGLSVS